MDQENVGQARMFPERDHTITDEKATEMVQDLVKIGGSPDATYFDLEQVKSYVNVQKGGYLKIQKALDKAGKNVKILSLTDDLCVETETNKLELGHP